MNKQACLLVIVLWQISPVQLCAQQAPKVTITGSAGIWYEHYGLIREPDDPAVYRARRPWNLVRFSFNLTITAGKFSIPFNFNFTPIQTNFVTPSVGGLGSGKKQSFFQFLTNPVNSFGINPKYKWAELQLGTQYLKYSELSTGDIGIFGYGVSLSPGKFRIRLFNGISQRPVNFDSAPPPGTPGAYQRAHWLAQLGMEKEDKYFVGFNFVKSKDKASSVTPTPLPAIEPQENMVVSFLAKAYNSKGWNYFVELGQSHHTRNLNTPLSDTIVKDFKPFIDAHTATNRDNAIMLGITKKGKDWELGGKFNYYGAGYYTAGYPFMSNDRLEYLLQTKFNAWKKKINVNGSIGQRYGNWNYTAGPDRTKQIIANVNVFTQFNDHFSLNAGYNNFGFNAPSLTGYKSVSNDLSINPTYTKTGKTAVHLISATYSWSKYDETIYPAPVVHNNSHTALLMYVPSFFKKKISPDVSVMWFRNDVPAFRLTLWNASAGLGWKLGKKLNLKEQLQYNRSSTTPYTANNNLLATSGFDWKITKKLVMQYSMTANLYRFGNEKPGSSFTPPYAGDAQYMESTIRTGLQYRW